VIGRFAQWQVEGITMSEVIPAIASVRPRVSRRGVFQRRLLEDVVVEYAEENPRGLLLIEGTAGGGKSTAISHLAAAFADDAHFQFFDEPTSEELALRQPDRFVVATFPTARVQDLKLELWSLDEIVEYILARYPTMCGSVIDRLGITARRRPWIPQLAAIVLDRFAANQQACDPAQELHLHVQERLGNEHQQSAVGRYCFAMITGNNDTLENARAELNSIGCPEDVRALLRHQLVQIPFAASAIINSIFAGSTTELNSRLPAELVEQAGKMWREGGDAATPLQAILNSQGTDAEPMAASILYAIDRNWRPSKRKSFLLMKPSSWRLLGGYFRAAAWSKIQLVKADLSQADFTKADLERADLYEADLHEARFDCANLRQANLNNVDATEASFTNAILSLVTLVNSDLSFADLTDADLTSASLIAARLDGADLTRTRLVGADLTRVRFFRAVLTETDLTGAVLCGSYLPAVDLRTARLDGANLENVDLSRSILEDVHFPKAMLKGANLHGAHLTGSKLPMADLRGANLAGAYLAEINWPGADLRDANLSGATFHMGSSRSGLVGSPIACEGSKTGFYTDDFEDRHFKRPEEIRKANLHRADLRGANLSNLDLYLVDLREAKLDQYQREHAQQCGAILKDAVA
jgi:uncharacterized protein YjbI with pentapeptide repeats